MEEATMKNCGIHLRNKIKCGFKLWLAIGLEEKNYTL